MKTMVYRDKVLRNRTGRADGWFVSDGKPAPRVRWGTLAQIKADVDALIDYGEFPESRAHLWA